MRQKVDWDKLNNTVDLLSRSLLMSGEEKLLSDHEIKTMNKALSLASKYAKNVCFISTLGKERLIDKLREPLKGNK